MQPPGLRELTEAMLPEADANLVWRLLVRVGAFVSLRRMVCSSIRGAGSRHVPFVFESLRQGVRLVREGEDQSGARLRVPTGAVGALNFLGHTTPPTTWDPKKPTGAGTMGEQQPSSTSGAASEFNGLWDRGLRKALEPLLIGDVADKVSALASSVVLFPVWRSAAPSKQDLCWSFTKHGALLGNHHLAASAFHALVGLQPDGTSKCTLVLERASCVLALLPLDAKSSDSAEVFGYTFFERFAYLSGTDHAVLQRHLPAQLIHSARMSIAVSCAKALEEANRKAEAP